jgi:surface antigen
VHQFAAALALSGVVAAGGCSLPLDTMFEKAEAQQTGSVTPLRRSAQVAPTESDLAYAGAVAVDALSRGGKDSSIPWQNPQTGAGGNVTPLASAYSEGDVHCRDFLASYVNGQSQAWLKGEACRTEQGKWEVRSLKQLRQG